MLIIAENLRGLASRTTLCCPTLVEAFSIRITLGPTVRRMRCDDAMSPILYGQHYEDERFFEPENAFDRDLKLAPGDRVLACSEDRYRMPPGYFGLVQTKGSLARLFVMATINDGQIEPGYEGRITLELYNLAHFPVHLPLGSTIAQMFVFRCSMTAPVPYAGRYQGADGPTIADFRQKV